MIKRRDNGAWQIPGGVLELGEAIEDGLRREVREETGLDIEPVRLTGVYKNMKLGVAALVFLARPTGGSPTPTDESADVAWWTTDQVKRDMVEAFAIRILDGLVSEQRPMIRAHDGMSLLRSTGA